MDLKPLDMVCYTVCIVCIVLGIIFALLIIWGRVDGEVAWKGSVTIAVFFFGGLATLGVNNAIENRFNNRRR